MTGPNPVTCEDKLTPYYLQLTPKHLTMFPPPPPQPKHLTLFPPPPPPKSRLLTKLDYYGIRGGMLMWISAFLSNRPQVVSINGVHSSPKPVLSGVPQGLMTYLHISNLTCAFFLMIESSTEKLKTLTTAGSYTEVLTNCPLGQRPGNYRGITYKKLPVVHSYL